MRSDFTSSSKGATIMKITTIGIDLAKQVFQVHGVDAQGNAVLRKKLERSKVLEFFVNCRRA
jgi:transposase